MVTPYKNNCGLVFNSNNRGVLTAFDSFTECVFLEDNITYIINERYARLSILGNYLYKNKYH